MSTPTKTSTLRIGHSPDPDDAFMWYPLLNGDPTGKTYRPRIDTGPYEFVHVLEDIQSLNRRAERGELEVTALSIHQYPFVAGRYALTSCGCSMGDRYGPMVVARRGSAGGLMERLRDRRVRIAVPGERTTAFLALSLLLGQGAFEYEVVPFDRIIPTVSSGHYEAGLIIHEGQLTYREVGLECVVDLGRWWTESRGLPLPLGGNAIRRDLGAEMGPICSILVDSIGYALGHREEALRHATRYAREMGVELADRFVGMYVNQWTLDYGQVGRDAVRRLLQEAADAGLAPACGPIDFVEPG
jgi:1,4-dihydroxy-6-naphthoate synthase